MVIDEKLCKDCPELSKGCGGDKNKDKVKRCVKQVKEQGKPEDSAYAICNASINKSTIPTVINTYQQGTPPVDLNTHLLAVNATSDCPYLEKLKKQTENMDMFGISDFSVVAKSGMYNISLSKNDQNQFKGVMRDEQGTIVQEFDNQTLEIIASIINAKIGDMVMDKLEPVVESSEDHLESAKAVVIELQSGIIEAQKSELEDIKDSLEQEMAAPKPTTEIEIMDGKIKITLLKSEENKMSFAEETLDMLIKAAAVPSKKFGKPEEEEEKQEAAPQPNGLDNPPAPEEQPASPEAAAPEAEESEDIEEDVKEADKAKTEEAAQASEQQIGSEQEEEVAPGQGDVLQEIKSGQPQDGENQMEQPVAGEMEPQLEYIKFSEHANGKQYWYKDPVTGQIHEKDNAPEGHPDYNHGEAMQDLVARVAELEAKVGLPVGGQEAVAPVTEDQKPMIPESKEMPPKAPEAAAPEAPKAESKQPEQLKKDEAPKAEAPAEKAPAEAKEEMSKEAAPTKPEAKKPFPPKKEEEEDKVKKSLKEKYPQISDEKLAEIIEKAKKMKKSDEQAIKPEVKDIVTDPKDEFTKIQEDKKKKVMKKSRLSRMWTVFNIEMPETLEKSEDIKKANEGIQKLQKCIMKQGKNEEEANRVINRAVIEKYDLLTDGSKYFQNFQEWKGGYNMNVECDPKDALEMQNLRKSDANKRFQIKEYIEHREELVLNKSTNINEQVKDFMKHEEPKWEGYKEFKEPMTKSTPTELEKSKQAAVDARWNRPEFKGNIDASKMINEKPSTMQERIEKSEKERNTDATFGDRYKKFDEEKTKMQKSVKTETEILNEKIEKANWTHKK